MSLEDLYPNRATISAISTDVADSCSWSAIVAPQTSSRAEVTLPPMQLSACLSPRVRVLLTKMQPGTIAELVEAHGVLSPAKVERLPIRSIVAVAQSSAASQQQQVDASSTSATMTTCLSTAISRCQLPLAPCQHLGISAAGVALILMAAITVHSHRRRLLRGRRRSRWLRARAGGV